MQLTPTSSTASSATYSGGGYTVVFTGETSTTLTANVSVPDLGNLPGAVILTKQGTSSIFEGSGSFPITDPDAAEGRTTLAGATITLGESTAPVLSAAGTLHPYFPELLGPPDLKDAVGALKVDLPDVPFDRLPVEIQGKLLMSQQGSHMGYALGTIAQQVVLALVTEGAGNVATLASKGVLLEKISVQFAKVGGPLKAAAEALGYVATEEGVVTKTVGSFAEGLATTTMCFVAGTKVLTDHGLIPIEKISVGDLVLSRNESTGEQSFKPVLQTVITHPDALYTVDFDPDGDGPRPIESLVTTAPHPFYVANRDGDGDGDGDGVIGGFVRRHLH